MYDALDLTDQLPRIAQMDYLGLASGVFCSPCRPADHRSVRQPSLLQVVYELYLKILL